MGYQIQMVPEVEAWLARVREADPPLADAVDEAVTALRIAGESLGVPLVVPLDAGQAQQPPPELSYQRELESLARVFRGMEAWLARLRARSGVIGPVADEASTALRALGRSLGPLFAVPQGTGLDLSFQRQLEMLTRMRRGVFDVTTSRKRAELRAAQLRGQLARLSEQLDEAVRDGHEAKAATIRAAARAARDRLRDLEAQLVQLAAQEEKLTVATRRLQDRIDEFRVRTETAAAGEAERLITEVLADPVPLTELRPGAPGEVRARILFTVRPGGTAVLVAAGTADDWVRAWQVQEVARLASGDG